MYCKKWICLLSVVPLLLTGCAGLRDGNGQDSRLHIVATTTMLADLARKLGGGVVEVEGLMGPGIDPHLYQASAGDVIKMQNADLVIYNGVHLEGKMGDVFQSVETRGIVVVCAGNALTETELLSSGSGAFDPHVWFDVQIWQKAAKELAEGMKKAAPHYAELFEQNLQQYCGELDCLHEEIKARIEKIPVSQRVLITAHDAFGYFGRAYGFTVKGLQGISTDSEAGTLDVSNLAQYIAEHKIKAVFVESSVSPRTVEALQAAVRARGFEVSVGGELYSDSLGSAGSETETYIQTVRYNVDTIVNALK